MIQRIQAAETHLIVDACHSFFLAHARGPGGTRRPLRGFARLRGLGHRGNVGLLLSTSSARESHEWEAYQGGVFSHQVRSGLYGAADVDGDGQVSYREIAAFVSRANAAIPNERFRPAIYARPPAHNPQLVDLRQALRRGVKIDGTRHGHYLLEYGRGVRIAEFHSGRGQAVALLRPAVSGRLYLHRLSDGTEYMLLPAEAPIELVALTTAERAVRTRGAAHDAFSLIFTLPFDRAIADAYRFPEPPPPTAVELAPPQPRPDRTRRIITYAFLGLGAATLVSAVTLTVATKLRGTQTDLAPRVSATDVAIPTLYATAGACAVGGLIYHLWPRKKARPKAAGRLVQGPGTVGLGYQLDFR